MSGGCARPMALLHGPGLEPLANRRNRDFKLCCYPFGFGFREVAPQDYALTLWYSERPLAEAINQVAGHLSHDCVNVLRLYQIASGGKQLCLGNGAPFVQ